MKVLILLSILATFSAGAQTNGVTVRTNKPRAALPAVAAPVPSEPKKIRILSVDGALSTYYKCNTSVGVVYLSGLPASLKADSDLIAKLTATTTREREAIKAERRKLNAESAAAPSQAASDSPAGQYIRQLNIRGNKLDERTTALNDQQETITEARQRFAAAANVTAVNTGTVYGVTPIWRVVAARE